jgi:hypothetical protein
MYSFIVVHERSITKCDLINNVIKTILFRKKIKKRPILRGKIVLMTLFIRSHFVIDRSCTTIKLYISSAS